MAHHDLKIDPDMFKEVVSGNKKFEFCSEADRKFTQGDRLTLIEFDRETNKESGYSYLTTIGFCLRGPKYGVPDGMVIFSIGG